MGRRDGRLSVTAPFWRHCAGKPRGICSARSFPPHRNERLETAEDEALGIERRLAGAIHALILMHPFLGGLEIGLAGPDLPGEDDLLALLRGDRAAEIRL